jgi:hypothetical protein
MATAPRITLLATILACMAGPAHGSGACSVSGSASAPSDVTRARAACDTAQRRFSELFGTQAPAALVVLHDRPAYELALAGDVGIVFWPNGAALAAGVGGGEGKDGRADAHWREVLPHELMHAMTMAHFFAHGNVANHGGYGTPLPDWFEEGVAIWGETMESRRARLCAPGLTGWQKKRHDAPAGTDSRSMPATCLRSAADSPARGARRARCARAGHRVHVHGIAGHRARRGTGRRARRSPVDRRVPCRSLIRSAARSHAKDHHSRERPNGVPHGLPLPRLPVTGLAVRGGPRARDVPPGLRLSGHVAGCTNPRCCGRIRFTGGSSYWRKHGSARFG